MIPFEVTTAVHSIIRNVDILFSIVKKLKWIVLAIMVIIVIEVAALGIIMILK